MHNTGLYGSFFIGWTKRYLFSYHARVAIWYCTCMHSLHAHEIPYNVALSGQIRQRNPMSPPHQKIQMAPPHRRNPMAPPHQKIQMAPPHRRNPMSPPHQKIQMAPLHRRNPMVPPHQKIKMAPPHWMIPMSLLHRTGPMTNWRVPMDPHSRIIRPASLQNTFPVGLMILFWWNVCLIQASWDCTEQELLHICTEVRRMTILR